TFAACGGTPSPCPSVPTRRSSDLAKDVVALCEKLLTSEKDKSRRARLHVEIGRLYETTLPDLNVALTHFQKSHTLDPTLESATRSEEHTSELQSREKLVCRLLLEK